MIYVCPNCNRLVLGLYKESGKNFCPHCKGEIVITIRNKHVFVILFALFALPFLFSPYWSSVVDVDGNFFIYFKLYNFFLFVFAMAAGYRNVTWERRK